MPDAFCGPITTNQREHTIRFITDGGYIHATIIFTDDGFRVVGGDTRHPTARAGWEWKGPGKNG